MSPEERSAQSSPSHEWRIPGMRIVFESQAAIGWFVVFMIFVGLPALVLYAREVIASLGDVVRQLRESGGPPLPVLAYFLGAFIFVGLLSVLISRFDHRS